MARLLPRLFRFLPFDVAVKLADYILQSQGFGSGASLTDSGEEGVFQVVPSNTPIVFDVGGHIGDYTAQVLRRFPKAQVLAFEPSAAHFERLRARFGADPRAKLFEVALAQAAGKATLFKPTEVSGLASLTQRRLDHIRIQMTLEEEVSCRTLDEVVATEGISRIHLLKVDVEGHELDVFKGAAKTLEDKRIDVIQFEFGGANLDTRTNLQDYFYLFNSLSYALHIVRPGGRLFHLRRYKEMYEQMRPTNFVAMLKR